MNHLAQTLFNLGAEAMFRSAHPTEHARATQQELAEVLEGEPMPRLTEAEVNHLAAEFEERHTEGHVPRHPFRTNFHE